MHTTPRYLITTADERTWKFDRPVVFLGEWCRLYERKHIWQEMDAIVAKPYGLGKEQKDTDYASARALEKKLFPILCDTLNEYHSTQHGLRFWQIVLGHWFRRYIDVIFNRVKTIEHCLQSYHVSGMTSFKDDGYSLATMDSYAAIWAFSNDRWNSTLYFYIMKLIGEFNCPVEIITGDSAEGFQWSTTATELPLKNQILKFCYRQMGKIAGLLSRDDDAFIINTYLPRIKAIELYLALGQVPQLWTSSKIDLKKRPDRSLRQSLSNKIEQKSNSTLFGIMCSLVFELLPVCYLEGFEELSKNAQQLKWPNKPKFIFTSNNFDTHELFKLWTSLKVESGCQYITGQHGNNYGTYRYMYPSIEEETSDKFLTWGWTDGLQQHIPTFLLKTAGSKAMTWDSNGGLLLIELHLSHRINTWDNTHEFKAYFEDQQTFIGKLQKPPRKKLIVRLHGSYIQFKWGEEERWRKIDSTLKLDTGSSDIRKLIAQSRLIIHSYDSTGILETLSQNIPSLAFWQNGFDHLRDSAKPFYQMLVEAGIVHLSPESAAAKVNEVWDNVDGWWTQSNVQEARKHFCDRYARMNDFPITALISVLS